MGARMRKQIEADHDAARARKQIETDHDAASTRNQTEADRDAARTRKQIETGRDAARDRVFNTAELLEMILLESPTRGLMHLRRVSKTFRNAIDGSQALLASFMFTQDADTKTFTPTFNEHWLANGGWEGEFDWEEPHSIGAGLFNENLLCISGGYWSDYDNPPFRFVRASPLPKIPDFHLDYNDDRREGELFLYGENWPEVKVDQLGWLARAYFTSHSIARLTVKIHIPHSYKCCTTSEWRVGKWHEAVAVMSNPRVGEAVAAAHGLSALGCFVQERRRYRQRKAFKPKQQRTFLDDWARVPGGVTEDVVPGLECTCSMKKYCFEHSSWEDVFGRELSRLCLETPTIRGHTV